MRKGRDGKKEKKEKRKEKKREKNGVYSGHYVIASSLPPKRLRPNDDRWNAARLCQMKRLMEIAATASLPSVDRWNAACANFKGRCLQSKVMSVLATRLRYNAVKQNLPVSRKEKRLDSCGLLNSHEQMSTKNENPMECNASFVLLSNLTSIIFAGITFCLIS